MHLVSLLLACVACTAFGRRARALSELSRGGAHQEQESNHELLQLQPGEHLGANNTLQSFAKLLLVMNSATGFRVPGQNAAQQHCRRRLEQALHHDIDAFGVQRAAPPMMVRGIMQEKKVYAEPFDPTSVEAVAPQLPSGSALPSLVVLDLDNTLWTPELYTLRHLQNYKSAGPPGPVADLDVWLLDGAVAALHELATCDLWQDTKVAVASRTEQGRWAHKLLADFKVAGRPMVDLMDEVEIRPGDKISHFENLHKATGIPYSKMIFFDDSDGGKWGNCKKIADLGVLCMHCPRGLTTKVWHLGLKTFAELTAAGEDMGRVVYPKIDGKVDKWFEDRGFGFISLESGENVYFQAAALPEGIDKVGLGSIVSVTLGEDRQFRLYCKSVDILESRNEVRVDRNEREQQEKSISAKTKKRNNKKEAVKRILAVDDGEDSAAKFANIPSDVIVCLPEGVPPKDLVTMPVFSMSMPFAALLGHGVKTIETRQHTMFVGTHGKKVLMQVGQKIMDDEDKHRDILEINGMSEDEIDRVSELPAGFSRGDCVAIVEMGRTWKVGWDERSSPEHERKVCAYDNDQGMYATEIRRVEWLPKPIRMPGQPRIFDRSVPRAALPAGFLEQEIEVDEQFTKKIRKKEAKKKTKISQDMFSSDDEVVFEMDL